ncbi:MAG: type II toxin-antitoxin system VapC family toxin [Burkholderiales bacterium]
MFLLDTEVIFELRKQRPNAGVVRWVSKQQDNQLHLSVVMLGEIERAIEQRRKADAEFSEKLAAWLESLMRLYADRLVPITPSVARRWGRLSAQLEHEGADLLIAATALTHGLTVVTRNVSDFEPTGVNVINPYSR